MNPIDFARQQAKQAAMKVMVMEALLRFDWTEYNLHDVASTTNHPDCHAWALNLAQEIVEDLNA